MRDTCSDAATVAGLKSSALTMEKMAVSAADRHRERGHGRGREPRPAAEQARAEDDVLAQLAGEASQGPPALELLPMSRAGFERIVRRAQLAPGLSVGSVRSHAGRNELLSAQLEVQPQLLTQCPPAHRRAA